MTPYVDALRAYGHLNPTRLNVPGHKGGPGAPPVLVDLLGRRPFELDVPPLLWGIDHGASPTPLESALRLAAEAWGARRTWFLTNGASQGNHVACLAVRSLGRRVVVQRSAHSSVAAGIILADLEPSFVAPTIDAAFEIAHGISAASLEAVLRSQPEVTAVHVTSPSYFGAVADIGSLARVAHKHGAALVVDESWGSHFGFHPELPASALSLAADLVISSTHKMAGSLTQSAMLHLGEGPFAGELEVGVERAISLHHSTSVSSLLLASLDAARQHLATSGHALLSKLVRRLSHTKRSISKLPGLAVADEAFLAYDDVVALDPLRVVVDVRGAVDGLALRDRLRALRGLDFELANSHALVAVFGASEATWEAAAGLLGVLEELQLETGAGAAPAAPLPPWPEMLMTPREAYLARHEIVEASKSVGRISADTLSAYPPGIPNLMPGEQISEAVLRYLEDRVRQGGHVRGAMTADIGHVRVVAAEPGRPGSP